MVEFSIFLSIICLGFPTVQHYCAACDNLWILACVKQTFVGYRDLAGLRKASIRLHVCNVYRRVVAACESTASNADTERVRPVLDNVHIRPNCTVSVSTVLTMLLTGPIYID